LLFHFTFYLFIITIMLFYQLLFLFRSYTFILLQEMIFFKKRSKKSAVKKTETVSLPPPPPSPPKQQQFQRESESWLQLNIPNDFSSSFDIPQFHEEQQIEKTVEINITRTIYTVSTTSAAKNDTELYTPINTVDNYLPLKEETLLPFINDTINMQKDLESVAVIETYISSNIEKSDEK
jgi:cellulose synthase/poly-beta-1,6-N-acetylglucosamine synthase-like glycosyltransferase